MALFTTYVGIDYSGAAKTVARNRGLRVFKAAADSDPVQVKSPAGKRCHWTRKEIAHWCRDQLGGKAPVIIGLDHGFSFPMSYMQRYRIASWDQFLDDFQKHWPTDQDDGSVEALRQGNKRSGKHTEFRLTENWTASTQSVFKLDGAGTVGKSTHCGIPWLRFMRRHSDQRRRTHFWPFDGFDVPPNRSVVAEIFPSIFRRRYARRYPSADEHDAMCVAWWLRDMDARGQLSTYLKPPLTAAERRIARLEGWILGIF
ncbi:MAG: hypothetical protein QNJ02_03985 [Desulfobacterales bacterium]|nr:hypothetical protein [Desulfobacterales bacterium]